MGRKQLQLPPRVSVASWKMLILKPLPDVRSEALRGSFRSLFPSNSSRNVKQQSFVHDRRQVFLLLCEYNRKCNYSSPRSAVQSVWSVTEGTWRVEGPSHHARHAAHATPRTSRRTRHAAHVTPRTSRRALPTESVRGWLSPRTRRERTPSTRRASGYTNVGSGTAEAREASAVRAERTARRVPKATSACSVVMCLHRFLESGKHGRSQRLSATPANKMFWVFLS